MSPQPSPKPPEPRISHRDRARLLENSARTANRWVWVNGVLEPVLHLSVIDLEWFRALVAPIEELYSEAQEHGFIETMTLHSDKAVSLCQNEVVEAAAVALHRDADDLRRSGASLMELLNVLIAQWLHNFEIAKIQELFTAPPDDKPDVSIPADPTADNPLAPISQIATGFHWSFAECAKLTVPQIYLLSNASGWSWHRSEVQSDPEKAKAAGARVTAPKHPAEKERKPFNKMSPDEYRQHLKTVGRGIV